ncbi:MAG: bifunctional aspartate kinase/homoserine dehydrogenase I [Deltaproteobacteria bacterium]|nr:bifunctional aspartate kinase/homoserine dehydrogenase I [Deltaproteobacteria bacterium]
MTLEPWVVHKFGGTSVAGAERYRAVAGIVRAEHEGRTAVVVSAMSGVTDRLLTLTTQARDRDERWRDGLRALVDDHARTARSLLPEGPAEDLVRALQADAEDLRAVLHAIGLGRHLAELTQELVAGHGELWSARMLHALLVSEGLDARCVDAREVLVVSPAELGPVVDWAASRARLDALRERDPAPWLVVTGYVASTREGVPTTLKRNGSDFSGAIFGALLDASRVVIWTDVDGVLTADPRRVPEAVVLGAMSYAEAAELAYFGAKVLHPRTMEPAVARGIPLWIRNTFNPRHPGTRIDARGEPGAQPVKGFSTFDGIALVTVEGRGMLGVPGVAERVFAALRAVGVSVVMISQASSEHSISFAVPEPQAERAREVVTGAFAGELSGGAVERVEVVLGCSVVAAVGDAMAQAPGVAARFFGALGGARVSVRAIAQGAGERNITAVIDRRDSTRALRAVHAGFYLSDKVLSVGVLGPGLVGAALLDQLALQAPVLKRELHLDLRVRGIARRGAMALSETGLDLTRWREALAHNGEPTDLERFARHVRSEHLPHAALVDATASDAVADQYARWLEDGLHVVTPNKRAGAGPLGRYRSLQALCRGPGRRWLYEATVGAGLPVIATLRELQRTGDRVLRVEGVLSGTLSYVFNRVGDGAPFSVAVAEARALGYTEPDPRDDLSGTDVARKLVILSRELGLSLEVSDVTVESVVPPSLAGLDDVEEFLRELARFDPEMASRRAEAEAAGEVLRYVGVATAEGVASVRLARYPREHAFGRLGATDNVFAFTTERYRARPLVVQGPGAGPEVTAGGVFGDLLRLAGGL